MPAKKDNVLAHPAFRKLPEPFFPLSDPKAIEEYNRIGGLLFNNGHLTLDSHRTLSSYAAQVENIQKALNDGKRVSANYFKGLSQALKKLKLNEIDQPIASPENAKTGKFSRVGFANRR